MNHIVQKKDQKDVPYKKYKHASKIGVFLTLLMIFFSSEVYEVLYNLFSGDAHEIITIINVYFTMIGLMVASTIIGVWLQSIYNKHIKEVSSESLSHLTKMLKKFPELKNHLNEDFVSVADYEKVCAEFELLKENRSIENAKKKAIKVKHKFHELMKNNDGTKTGS